MGDVRGEQRGELGRFLSPFLLLLFGFAFLFARIVYPSSQVDSRPLGRETKENEPENIRKQYIVPAIDWLPPISNHPETSYINIPGAEDVRYDTVRGSNRGKDTGCFLPDIAFQESIPLFGLRIPDIYWKQYQVFSGRTACMYVQRPGDRSEERMLVVIDWDPK